MQEGFIPDFAGVYGGKRVIVWVEGEPEPSTLEGGVKTSDRANFLIATYRCVSCGYLEFYATEEI